MQKNIYIPKKIRVGFQKREDTYTGKLGYIIYYDAKNKLRKEASFNGWIDQNIDVLEFENNPQSGFVFNRGVKRYSSFNYSAAKIRVYDERNFEFEIDMSNLVEIMKHSDISHQEIEKKCIFAWQGKELVLLPINSELYTEAQKYTTKILNPLNVREFIPGQTFKNKAGTELIYLGDYYYYSLKGYSKFYENSSVEQIKKKQSFFYDLKDKKYFNVNKQTMIELYDENINKKYINILENLKYGIERFNFTDFVINSLSREQMHVKILSYLSNFAQKRKKTENYYIRNQSVFPSEIFISLNGKNYTVFNDNSTNFYYLPHKHKDKDIVEISLQKHLEFNFNKNFQKSLGVEINKHKHNRNYHSYLTSSPP